MAFVIFLGVVFGIMALVILAVFVMGREYDRHPWLKRFMDAQAAMHVPAPRDPDPRDSLPKSYTDQTPGGWDSP